MSIFTRCGQLSSLALTFFLAVPAQAGLYSAQDLSFAQKAMENAGRSENAWDFVASLTTEIGARPAGSKEFSRAVDWAKNKLESLHFDRVWLEPVDLPRVWQRGPAAAEVVSPTPRQLAVAALGGSVSTPEGGVRADVAYYDDFDALVADTSARARGRIVFINEKMEPLRSGAGYGKAVRGRMHGAVEASKRGALALVIRSVTTKDDEHPHTGMMEDSDNVAAIPAVAISALDADALQLMHDGGKIITLQLSTQNHTSRGQSYNVLAEIRGSEKPEQVVAIGGHLDSWDLGRGAQDDGAGVAITVSALEILRDLSVSEKARPKRTIRVILFANEENGLDGAWAYAKAHGNEKHQLVSESDLGSGRVYRFDTHVASAARPWIAEIQRLLAPLGIEAGTNEGETGSDLSVIAEERGFAVASLEQDATAYFDVHHSANDTLDNVDHEGLKQNVAAWAAMVWLAAQAGVDF